MTPAPPTGPPKPRRRIPHGMQYIVMLCGLVLCLLSGDKRVTGLAFCGLGAAFIIIDWMRMLLDALHILVDQRHRAMLLEITRMAEEHQRLIARMEAARREAN